MQFSLVVSLFKAMSAFVADMALNNYHSGPHLLSHPVHIYVCILCAHTYSAAQPLTRWSNRVEGPQFYHRLRETNNLQN